MTDVLVSIARTLRWQDALDIAVLTVLFYAILTFIQGTRAAQILTGLAVLGGFYYLTRVIDLAATHWLIGALFSNLFLVVVILFQDDIRRAFARFGKTRGFFSRVLAVEQARALENISKAAASLAEAKIGALIVIEREIGLNDYVEVGTVIDAVVDEDLLYSIFLPYSPLHDGAVIVQSDRIKAAGCFLPLHVDPTVSRHLGTRHRAAMGITSETDALAVVVSEEEGRISLAFEGRITPDLDGATLLNHLTELLRRTA
ncbi:MAG: diadenylate cyclase CdaA [Deltaproteobacteria bacterium]|nr:diadenylate cyclase CdaA [Deltaproteobacteria bacterium]